MSCSLGRRGRQHAVAQLVNQYTLVFGVIHRHSDQLDASLSFLAMKS
jgi:hypothetical protein